MRELQTFKNGEFSSVEPFNALAARTELKAECEKAKASMQDCKDLVAISVIAKDYGWSANRMNRYLHDKGVQYKQGNKIWLLYQKYADKGYTNTRTYSFSGRDGSMHTAVHTYWTQAGRLFIYHLLKADGILPMME